MFNVLLCNAVHNLRRNIFNYWVNKVVSVSGSGDAEVFYGIYAYHVTSMPLSVLLPIPLSLPHVI